MVIKLAELLSLSDLPDEFTYPASFVRVVELGLTDLEPWQILVGDQLRRRYHGLATRFPDRRLIPFARRQDNDDVACWDLDEGDDRVVIIHDFASRGWENRAEFPNFYSWLRSAIEDLIEFD